MNIEQFLHLITFGGKACIFLAVKA